MKFITTLLIGLFFIQNVESKTLKNEKYEVILNEGNHSITVNGYLFKPTFRVIQEAADSVFFSFSRGSGQLGGLFNPCWSNVKPLKKTKKEYEYFKVGENKVLTPYASNVVDNTISWQYRSTADYDFNVMLTLGNKKSSPKIAYDLTAKKEALYSVVYEGSPEFDTLNLRTWWHPPFWNERRFPSKTILHSELASSMSMSMVENRSNTCIGVIADPDHIPFRAPNRENVLCGTALRNSEGQAQPIILSPFLGGEGSKLSVGDTYNFAFRLFINQGSTYETHKDLAYKLYDFRDMRKNFDDCNLNCTLDNMIDFALDDKMAQWNHDLRGSDYSTDIKSTVKNVSSIHALSTAFIRDNQKIFDDRFLDMVESLLSREKYLFTTEINVTGQGASSKMDGPTAEVSEWTSLYNFTKGRCDVLKRTAFERFYHPRILNLKVLRTDSRWLDYLSLYRLNKNKVYLDSAIAIADVYLKERVDILTPLNPGYQAQFWTDHSPRWMELYELYEETGFKRYLDGAIHGAKLYATFCLVSPKVPKKEVTFSWTAKEHYPVPSGTSTKPAWVFSNTGLTSEATNTLVSNPAVMLTTYAPWFLKIAEHTEDPFFKDIARNCIVGRYRNYPGYDINFYFTDLFQKADYPTSGEPMNHRYSQFYFNHIWPQITMLIDYLFKEVETKSLGAIKFPTEYAQGYVYIQSQTYGAHKGDFYGDKDITPWMPADLVRVGNKQVNYISARGNNNVYVAFTNQSYETINTEVSLNSLYFDAKELSKSKRVTVWIDNKKQESVMVEGGAISLTIPSKGLVAIRIEGLNPTVDFQEKINSSKSLRTDANASIFQNDPFFGKISAHTLTFGKGLTSLYFYAETPAINDSKLSGDFKNQFSEVTLNYKVKGEKWKKKTDLKYPYEFRLPISDKTKTVEYYLTGKGVSGFTVNSSKSKVSIN